jgi:hypothetical protein
MSEIIDTHFIVKLNATSMVCNINMQGFVMVCTPRSSDGSSGVIVLQVTSNSPFPLGVYMNLASAQTTVTRCCD